MELLDELRSKIQELITLELNKGVSPVELSSSIFEEGYHEIKIKKEFGAVKCSVLFYDEEFFDKKKKKIEYRYVYNNENFLEELYCIKNKNTQLIWSRKDERDKILKDILLLSEKSNDFRLINFDKIPDNVRKHLDFLLHA